uniref:ATP synthase F0 subunit 9 n=1 Tax=Sirodotia delicatula TaxID=386631 RepID=A0A343UY45_9FLOR|nr:ATP synthase F0 subunit 9 [Sirodotia delicatula]AVK39602.1 ATP synthase F0 subunit 9 [Sirodotia delicatula]
MLNYFILLAMLFTFNGIILLNEETLILICFVTFSWLFSKNVGLSLKIDLDKRNAKIKDSLETSLDEITTVLGKTIDTKQKFWNLFYNFTRLSKHYLKFTYSVTNWFSKHQVKSTQAIFPKQLQFIHRVEDRILKLLVLIIIKKLKNITLLKAFYSIKLKNPHFLCLHSVNIRQCIKFIKLS